MDLPTETNTVNKTLHLTGIGLAVQAFYINLTLDSILGKEYLHLAPVGPVTINPTSVWKINGVPLNHIPGKSGGGRRSDKLSGLNEQDDDDVAKRVDALRDSNGRQKVHKTSGIKISLQKDESGDEVTHHPDDGNDDEEDTANEYKSSPRKDKEGWFNEVGTRRSPNNQREVIVSREIVPIIPRRRF